MAVPGMLGHGQDARGTSEFGWGPARHGNRKKIHPFPFNQMCP
jgi:hypothetical protein